MERLAAWFIKLLLDWLLKRAIDEANAKIAEMSETRRRGDLNDENSLAYEKALNRVERINESLKLLNRD